MLPAVAKLVNRSPKTSAITIQAGRTGLGDGRAVGNWPVSRLRLNLNA